MKKIIKILIAVIISFGITALVAYFTCNEVFIHRTDNKAVDFSYEPYAPVRKITEGAFWGKANNEGLWNLEDYNEGDEIDVLLMGTSHMRGNINPKYSIASYMNRMMPDCYTYSIGAANHTFAVQAKNLGEALNRYKPDYVVMEYISESISKYNFIELMIGFFPEIPVKDSNANVLTPVKEVFIDRFCKLFHIETEKKESKYNSTPIEKISVSQVFKSLKARSEAYGTKIILLYHPSAVLINGELKLGGTEEERTILSEVCKENGIVFYDLTDSFLKEFKEKHVLLHGFNNSRLGSGHLNKNGNILVAGELKKIIEEQEER